MNQSFSFKKFLASFVGSLVAFVLILSTIPASAQYGGSSSGGSSNVTTSVNGNQLTISFSNIAAGNSFSLTGLNFGDLSSAVVVFDESCANGSIVLTNLPSNQIQTNLPNSFIKGYDMAINGCSATAVDSVTVQVKVSKAAFDSYETGTIKGYYSNGVWIQASGITNLGTDSAGNIIFSITSPSFKQLALSGTLSNGNLIRTGASENVDHSISMMSFATVLIIALLFFSVQPKKTVSK